MENLLIRTPDQRLRVFVSSTLQELREEREAVREAISCLRLAPVMFELGARPHPPRALYRAYLEQSHIFVGIYWQSYGWVAPGEEISGLEDEFRLSEGLPRLLYVKSGAGQREEHLTEFLNRIKEEGLIAYKRFSTAEELAELAADDLALLLSEGFEALERGHPALATGSSVGVAPAAQISRGVRTPIPLPPTPFVGRQEELARLEELLLDEKVPLVTLTGPGGTGKTRLALEAARALAGGFHRARPSSTSRRFRTTSWSPLPWPPVWASPMSPAVAYTRRCFPTRAAGTFSWFSITSSKWWRPLPWSPTSCMPVVLSRFS